jgi:hypothetical protein
MVDRHLIVATIDATGGQNWELSGATNLAEGDSPG